MVFFCQFTHFIRLVGCSNTDTEFNDDGEPVTLEKWLVNVECVGCKGLFYRSEPGVIVPDADWPRNGKTHLIVRESLHPSQNLGQVTSLLDAKCPTCLVSSAPIVAIAGNVRDLTDSLQAG